MSKRCYYEILGVPEGRDGDELKNAYRKLAMQFHPDRNPGDTTAEVKFKEINEAYDVLKDDQKRAAYDRFGHAAFERRHGRGGAGGAGRSISPAASPMCSTICSATSWAARRGQAPEPRQDLRYNLEITLEEAFARPQRRDQGADPGRLRGLQRHRAPKPAHDAETCPTCAGHGKVRATQGFFTIERTCPPAAAPASHPQSLQDLPRRGPGAEGTHADVSISAGRRGRHPHPAVRRRRGRRARRPARRSLYFPVGGRTPDLPARRPRSPLPRAGPVRHRGPGRQRSKCRPSTAAAPRSPSPKAPSRAASSACKAKGMPVLRSAQRGDLYIEVAVETPVKLTKRQKELLREFESGARPAASPKPKASWPG